MGASFGHWVKRIIYFTIFYTVLGVFSKLLWMVFESTLDDVVPSRLLDDSLIGSNPGLGVRPLPVYYDGESTLIRINMSDNINVRFWDDDVSDFLSVYQRQDTNVDCKRDERSEMPCSFPLRYLGPCANPGQIYSSNITCIYLKLNKIIGWIPEEYDIHYLPQNMPPIVKQMIAGNENDSRFKLPSAYISCEGVGPLDQENIGPINYYPELRFPGHYFPYLNKKGYLSPLVAVEFEDIKRDVLIKVECKVWAKNIQHDRKWKRGLVNFGLEVNN